MTETGIAVETMSALRMLRRKKSSTKKLMSTPMSAVDDRLPRASVMKVAVFHISRNSMSAPARRAMSGRAAWTASAARTVFAPDCLRTIIKTEGRPSTSMTRLLS